MNHNSENWKLKRIEFIEYRKSVNQFKCDVCKKSLLFSKNWNICVHHKTYDRVGNEDIYNDLELHHRYCHDNHHKNKNRKKMKYLPSTGGQQKYKTKIVRI